MQLIVLLLFGVFFSVNFRSLLSSSHTDLLLLFFLGVALMSIFGSIDSMDLWLLWEGCSSHNISGISAFLERTCVISSLVFDFSPLLSPSCKFVSFLSVVVLFLVELFLFVGIQSSLVLMTFTLGMFIVNYMFLLCVFQASEMITFFLFLLSSCSFPSSSDRS